MLNIAFCDTNQIFKDHSTGAQLLGQCLTELEQLQMHEYQGAKRQVQFLAGRLAAKKALQKSFSQGSLTDLDIEIRKQNLNKQSIRPNVWLKGIQNNSSLSISHSENIACAVSSSRQVGIDVEKISRRSSVFYEDVLTDAEFQCWQKMNQMQPHVADFLGTLYWTAKEAMSKCLGLGLSVPFDFFQVDFNSLSLIDSSINLEKWFLYNGEFIQGKVKHGGKQGMQLWSRLLTVPDGDQFVVTVSLENEL